MPSKLLEDQLPIHSILGEVLEYLEQHHRLIVEAPPGAGKTTILPLAFLDTKWLGDSRIVMLQPRRLAARNAALRMADLLGEKPGETVGYRMRLDTKVSARTRIEVVTEGVLLRMLREDPALSHVGMLIFDEFHERSLDADLGLALALHACETFRTEHPLRLCVMSATLAQDSLEELLNARAIRSDGRLFPVTQEYGQASKPRERIADRVVSVLQQAIAKHGNSSILVFLPGQGEIRRVAEQLDTPTDVSVHALFGDLSMAEQRRAIQPSPSGQRKVVLATNIAETSLTIDGVDVVVDSGLERMSVYDPNTGMSRLQTVKISQASAEQRMGRAGRLRPGFCYRLWSEAQHQQLVAQQAPEILNADLTSMALQLFAWGVYDPGELTWLTPPPVGAYQQAIDLLRDLGAIEYTANGPQLTTHGDAMADLPVHPRLAHMLLAGQAAGVADTAALVAAVLSDRDPLSRETADMRTRLEYLTEETPCPTAFRGWMHRTRQLAGQFVRQLPVRPESRVERPTRAQQAAYLIACAYPDRIARQRHSEGYQLANGRSAQFENRSSLAKAKWLAVAEISGSAGRRGDTIRSAAPLDPELFDTLLSGMIQERDVIDWDSKSGRFMAERRRHCGALVLSRTVLADVTQEQRVAKLLEIVGREAMANLPWREETRHFLGRARLMNQFDHEWPAFDEAALLSSLDAWLAPYLDPIHKLSELKRLDVLDALKARLSWDQQQRLAKTLPERINVPSGSSIRVDYSQDPPVLAVKLQEMFGCETTPAVADGRLPLLVHLLSPAGRPLQVTQDLAGFWRSGYEAVKKEMRGRYPKHPWPDNPLEATASRHTKRRQP